MTNFIPGLRLSADFFHEAVEPILAVAYQGVPYSAALIGSGSEVLGFDTEMSSDHHWGPRVMIFLHEADHACYHEAMRRTLSQQLPRTFRGYPTSFTPPNPEDSGTQLLQATDAGPINHRVDVLTARGFWLDYLNFDIDHAIEPLDWLTFPEQKLRTLVAGAVFHDEVGLQAVRDRFAYYPHDVWLYMLAAGWACIGQEEHLMGRAKHKARGVLCFNYGTGARAQLQNVERGRHAGGALRRLAVYSTYYYGEA